MVHAGLSEMSARHSPPILGALRSFEIDEPLLDIGRIGGAYGVRGWLRVASYASPPENILKYQFWFLYFSGKDSDTARQNIRRVECLEGRRHGATILARISACQQREEALALRGMAIAIRESDLPSLAEDEYYWHQLRGLSVVSISGGVESRLGYIHSLFETGSNDVLVVEPDEQSIDDSQRLIPYLRGDVVLDIDLKRGLMKVDWHVDF